MMGARCMYNKNNAKNQNKKKNYIALVHSIDDQYLHYTETVKLEEQIPNPIGVKKKSWDLLHFVCIYIYYCGPKGRRQVEFAYCEKEENFLARGSIY